MTEKYTKRNLNIRKLVDNPIGTDQHGRPIPEYDLTKQRRLDDFTGKYLANDSNGKQLFLTHWEIEKQYGANKEYTGNGVTMSLTQGNGRTANRANTA